MNPSEPNLKNKYYEYLFLQTLDTLCAWSASQSFQDIFALWASLLIDSMLRASSQHAFVEFGAIHPINNSNSYLLEMMGWSGGVSEPNPAFGSLFKTHRKCYFSQVGIGAQAAKTQLYVPKRRARATTFLDNLRGPDSEMEVHEIEIITLSTFINRMGIGAITFLSADTEGGEYNTLKAFRGIQDNLASFCIEVDKLSEKDLNESRIYFKEKGFARVFEEISGADDWYIKETLISCIPYPVSFNNQLQRLFKDLQVITVVNLEKARFNRRAADQILSRHGFS
jgi:hypothetical protein